MSSSTRAWWAVLGLTLCMAACAARYDVKPPAMEARAQQQRRDQGAARACEGRAFEWNGAVVECFNEARP